jgi:hypothetical protein
MNLHVRPSLLYVAFRNRLLSSPAAGTEQGACCSWRLPVGVEGFRDIAVMAAVKLQWEKSGRRFGNWSCVDFRQDGVSATPTLYGAWK